jgi:glucose/arabinose dehydrogenase
VTELPDGSLLVADDSGGKMWRVTSKGGNIEAQMQRQEM